ncbi:hypothetical protein ILUMI_16246 [Ignelater luminosus]|uniref:Uncharacterized protein n=1 Tax=Ignelater luminosus TaxID=2038154 RepID=A0A8K0CTB4_IGNLU|nr:hypothetical protein ILUMI_16246 [Ignelater luminosus]
MSVKNISQLTRLAYLRAFTASNIVSSFNKPGIWPLNRLALSDEDFSSGYVTDRLLPENMNTIHQENKQTLENIPPEPNQNETELGEERENDEHVSLKDSGTGDVLNSNIPLSNTPSCSFTKQNIFRKVKIIPESMRPYFKAGERKKVYTTNRWFENLHRYIRKRQIGRNRKGKVTEETEKYFERSIWQKK